MPSAKQIYDANHDLFELLNHYASSKPRLVFAAVLIGTGLAGIMLAVFLGIFFPELKNAPYILMNFGVVLLLAVAFKLARFVIFRNFKLSETGQQRES